MSSRIQYSPQFIHVLKSTPNEISGRLLALYNQDFDITHNYIDLGGEDSVTFIAETKVQQILGQAPTVYKITSNGGRLTNSVDNQHIYQSLGLELPKEIVRFEVGTLGKILNESIGKTGNIYVLFEDVSGVQTIINKRALSLIDDREDRLWKTNRNPIKVGRVAQSLLTAAGQTFTAAEIEHFVNDYKASIKVLNDAFQRFDIVQGDNIIEWYQTRNYSSVSGVLGNSCMNNMSSFLHIYAKNPQVQLVILYDKGGVIHNGSYKSEKIVGRAILWQLDDKSNISGYFLDRIYTIDDSDVDLFKKYAENQGWWYKKDQSSGTRFTALSKNATCENPIVNVSLETIPEEFPYLDTLCFMLKKEAILTNNENSSYSHTLTSTDGHYDNYDDEDEMSYDYDESDEDSDY